MSEAAELHVNGKWIAQKLTGTQRYAGETVDAIADSGRARLVLHVPADASVPAVLESRVAEIRRSRLRGFAFEQAYLPWATRGKILLNFAGPAPIIKRRQLVTMHDATPFRYSSTFRRAFVIFYYVMYFVLARTARQIITVSHFSAGELSAILRVPADRFLVAYCAADVLVGVEPERPELELPERFYLSVGTQAVHKNLAGPVSAVAGSGRKIVVVGMSGKRIVFADAKDMSGEAIGPGHLSDGELVWLYRHAQALVFPSKYEGFGLPPLEAQLQRCPVVSSNAASMPEVCGDGALYFDPDKTEDLLARLDRLENEHGLADSLREAGERNGKRFSWRSSADLILDALGVPK